MSKNTEVAELIELAKTGHPGAVSPFQNGVVDALERVTAPMTKEAMQARINLLSGEMDANEEENRAMQAEIDGLYANIDALG